MHHWCLRSALGLSLLVPLFGCAGGANSADVASASSMSSSDAEAFITDVQRQRGLPLEHPPVGSIDELLGVIENDQVGRFSEGERLVAGKPGIDAMALHATIELAWSDDFSTLSLILSE